MRMCNRRPSCPCLLQQLKARGHKTAGTQWGAITQVRRDSCIAFLFCGRLLPGLGCCFLLATCHASERMLRGSADPRVVCLPSMMQAIFVDAASQELLGASDPRKDGAPAAAGA